MKAVLDIGSNTIKLLVANVGAAGIEPQFTSSRVVRLAEGFHKEQKITDAALARARQALSELKVELDPWKANLRIVATAAVREASNSEEFCQLAKEIFSEKVEILSGEEEAKFSIMGSSQCLSFLNVPAEKVIFLDHGGASTEMGLLAPSFFAQSFPIGAVKAFEMLGFPEDIIEDKLWNEKDKHFEKFFTTYPLERFKEQSRERNLLLAAGGTLVQMAIAMKAKKIANDLFLCEKAEVESFIENLRKLSIEDRENKIHIEHGRADIMPAGVSLILYLMKVFNIEKLAVTSWGLRHGLLSSNEKALGT